MKFNLSNRQRLSASVIFFYLAPLLFFALYSIHLMPRHKSWLILSLGLLIVACGALALTLLLYYWEHAVRQAASQQNFGLLNHDGAASEKVTFLGSTLNYKEGTSSERSTLIDLHQYQKEQEQLQSELDQKMKDLKQKEEDLKQLTINLEQISQDYADYKIFSEEQLKQKNLQISNLQQAIDDQRAEMEKRLEQIQQLDTKVHDLSYEIKTLLHLNENDYSLSKETLPKEEDRFKRTRLPFEGAFLKETPHLYNVTLAEEETTPLVVGEEEEVKDSSDALLLLKKCFHNAQKLSGAHYYASEASRYKDLPSHHYAMDLRRLFDSLKGETGAIIFVYSPKEDKVLFANSYCKSLLGVGSEKFIQDFSQLMVQSSDWKKGLSQLASQPRVDFSFIMKTKNGQDMLLQCYMGTIPSGLFRQYIIGVLYPI